MLSWEAHQALLVLSSDILKSPEQKVSPSTSSPSPQQRSTRSRSWSEFLIFPPLFDKACLFSVKSTQIWTYPPNEQEKQKQGVESRTATPYQNSLSWKFETPFAGQGMFLFLWWKSSFMTSINFFSRVKLKTWRILRRVEVEVLAAAAAAAARSHKLESFWMNF